MKRSQINNFILSLAAHCIQNKHESKPKLPEHAIIFIGKYNLAAFDEEGSVRNRLSNIIVHPDWKPFDDRYDADIAVLILRNYVDFSYVIQPICLWTFNTDLNEIVGIKGAVVGWGEKQRIRKISVVYIKYMIPKTIEIFQIYCLFIYIKQFI